MTLMMAEFGNTQEVIRQWKTRFDSEPPDRRTIKATYDKFQETGSVADVPRSGRPPSAIGEEELQAVDSYLEENPRSSVRNLAHATGMSSTAAHHATKILGFSSYRPQRVVKLTEEDFDVRLEFCETMVQRFHQDSSLMDKIVWSDESQFCLNGQVNRHNCTYWAKQNPHVRFEVATDPRGVMVWCGITSSRLIGPYFFDGPVNGAAYLQMLEEYVWPQMTRRGLHFQHDGASAHYALQVRNWLNTKLPGRWIGRRGPTEWPPRSPDLTPCDFYLWGRLKNIVYRERPATLDQLRDSIRTACAEIPQTELAKVCQSVASRFQACIDLGGKQLMD